MDNEDMIARQLIQLARKIKQRRNLHIKDLKLTMGQGDALKYFGDHPNRTISMFKSDQSVTHQTARVIIQHMVQTGLFTLVRNPEDGRSKLVNLTKLGSIKYKQLNAHGWQTSSELFKGFTSAEQQQFLTLARRANANLDHQD